MRLTLQTPVAGDYRQVLARFDRTLFAQLTPPGAKVELVRFDGSHEGDVVHIRLHLPLLPAQDWVSHITDEGETAERAWFTDEGQQLPFFLRRWRHQHIVENRGQRCVIVDAIEFGTPVWLPAILLWPVLWAQFAYRKPVYRRVFGK